MDLEWALYVRESAGRAGIRTGRALATLLSACLMEDDFREKLRLRRDIELMLARFQLNSRFQNGGPGGI